MKGIYGITLKVIQGQKGPIWFEPLWSISANISETVHHHMMKVCMENIYIVSHIWPFSLPDKIWPWMTLQDQIKVNDILVACYS